MVQTLVNLESHQDRILNIVKGKFGFKNKNDAIKHIIGKYEEKYLEPELRPEYIKKAIKIHGEPSIKIKDFKKHFGL